MGCVGPSDACCLGDSAARAGRGAGSIPDDLATPSNVRQGHVKNACMQAKPFTALHCHQNVKVVAPMAGAKTNLQWRVLACKRALAS